MPGDRWQPSAWTRSALGVLSYGAMRSMWMAPVVHVALTNRYVRPPGLIYPAWLVLALLVGSAALNLGLGEKQAGPYVGSVLGLLAALASVAWLTPIQAEGPLPWLHAMARSLFDLREFLPAQLIVLLSSATIWVVGLRSGWGSHSAVWRSFVRGTLVLSTLLLLELGTQGTVRGGLTRSVLGFALAGLLALAILGARQIGGDTPGRMMLSRYWLLTVGIVVVLIVVAGWVIGQIVSPGAVAEMWSILRPIWRPVGEVLRLMLVLLAYAIGWLLRPLMGLFEQAGSKMEGLELEAPPSFEELAQEQELLSTGSIQVQTFLAILAGLALAAILVALFMRAWKRRGRAPESAGPIEERESIWSLALAREQLRQLLRRASGPGRERPFLDLEQVEERRRAVRGLYQKMLAKVSAWGQAREPGRTPAAYAEEISRRAPAASQAIHTLTGIYEQARYASELPTPQQVTQALAAWREIEGVLDRLEQEDAQG